jgi:hypothetical protein
VSMALAVERGLARDDLMRGTHSRLERVP